MFKLKSAFDLVALLVLLIVVFWWGRELQLFPREPEPIKTLPMAEGVTDPVRQEAHRRVTAILSDVMHGVSINSIYPREDVDRYPAGFVAPRIDVSSIAFLKDIKIAAVVELYRYVNDEQALAYVDLSEPSSSRITFRMTTVGQFAWCAIHRLLGPQVPVKRSDIDGPWDSFNFVYGDVLNLPDEIFQQMVSEQLDPWYASCIDESELALRCNPNELPVLVDYPPEH